MRENPVRRLHTPTEGNRAGESENQPAVWKEQILSVGAPVLIQKWLNSTLQPRTLQITHVGESNPSVHYLGPAARTHRTGDFAIRPKQIQLREAAQQKYESAVASERLRIKAAEFSDRWMGRFCTVSRSLSRVLFF